MEQIGTDFSLYPELPFHTCSIRKQKLSLHICSTRKRRCISTFVALENENSLCTIASLEKPEVGDKRKRDRAKTESHLNVFCVISFLYSDKTSFCHVGNTCLSI